MTINDKKLTYMIMIYKFIIVMDRNRYFYFERISYGWRICIIQKQILLIFLFSFALRMYCEFTLR